MVIKKPMQFTIVIDVPLVSFGAFCATNVENKGESAITTNPQNNKKHITRVMESLESNKGEIRQQIQEENNIKPASLNVPIFCE